jgi:lysylphosphatidylglycerol synthetase-like protein (DUF2156 family)
MTAFEFVFPLFGLLVGLSFAEMLSGLARALKSAREVRVGWLTPLLGTLILINLTMFWQGAWEVRDVAAPTSVSLLLILAVGGGYFLAASMVFPSPGEEVRDLDSHFMANRTVALLAIAACNLAYLALVGIEAAGRLRPMWWVGNGLFLALLVVAAFARDRRVTLVILAILILAHAVLLVFG